MEGDTERDPRFVREPGGVTETSYVQELTFMKALDENANGSVDTYPVHVAVAGLKDLVGDDGEDAVRRRLKPLAFRGLRP